MSVRGKKGVKGYIMLLLWRLYVCSYFFFIMTKRVHTVPPPTSEPSGQPSSLPSSCPTGQPSGLPLGIPTTSPSSGPSSEPSYSCRPSGQPSALPSTNPSTEPTSYPISYPSGQPSGWPTSQPSFPVVGHPEVVSCKYSNDTDFVIVTFDRSSNMANLDTTFMCKELVLNISYSASCRWIDSSSFKITQSVSESYSIGETIKIIGSKLQAACPDGVPSDECSSWPMAPIQLCSVVRPLLAVVPVVVISAPTVIDMCTDFVLDVSFSRGSGGQSYVIKSVDVSSSTGAEVTAIQTFYDSFFSVNPPTLLPKSYLDFPNTFSFNVTLCNFFGNCNYALHQLSVINDSIPVAYILGEKERHVYRADEVTLDAVGYVSVCNSLVHPSVIYETGLTFDWKVYKNDFLITTIKSGSPKNTRFLVKPFTLEFNYAYKFELAITSDESGDSITLHFLLYLRHAEVVAKISNDNIKKAVRVGESVLIDGSNSYDEDFDYFGGESSGLSFSWSCRQSFPVVSDNCGLNLTSPVDGSFFPTTPDVRIFPIDSLDNIDTVSIVTLTVMSTDSSRTDSTSVEILVTSKADTKLALTSLTSYIFLSDYLRINGEVVVPYESGVKSVWSVDDTSLNLTELALSSVTWYLPQGTHYIDFMLRPNTLYHGNAFVFTLHVGNVSSAISVSVVSPPTQGSFVTSPISGVEFTDYFVMSTFNWKSNELPLVYSFGFFISGSRDNRFLVMKEKSQRLYTSGLWLPSGISHESNIVLTAVTAQDSLSSVTTMSMPVTVTSVFFSNKIFEEMIEHELSRMSPKNNVDSVRGLISSTTIRMNKVSCAAAPSCSLFNRNNCLHTENTCGLCFEGYFGIPGDHNSPCYSDNTVFVDSTALSQACVLDSDCFSGQNCNNRMCSYSPKQCMPACSNNGLCQLRVTSTDNVLMEGECLDGDTSCYAICDCLDGYTGTLCSSTIGSLDIPKRLRETLILAYNLTFAYEDIGSDSITKYLALIYELSMNRQHLTVASCNTLYDLMYRNLKRAMEYSVPYTDLEVLYSAADNCEVAIYNENYYVTNRRLSVTSTCDYLQGGDQVVGTLMDYVAKSLSHGDFDLDYIRNFSRTKIRKMNMSDEYVIAVPDTDMEAAFGVIKSSVTIPSGSIGLASKFNSNYNNPVVVGILQEKVSKSYCNSSLFISDPIELQLFLSSEYTLLAGENVSATLAFSRPQLFLSSSNETFEDRVVFSSNCSAGNFSIFRYECPTGEVVVHRCPGKDKKFVSYCPEILYHPDCSLIENGSIVEGSDVCTRGFYNSTHVQCTCRAHDVIVASSSFFSSSSDMSYVGKFNIVSLGVISSKGSVMTISSRGTLPVEEETSDLVLGIVLLGMLWALGSVCVVYLLYSIVNDVIHEGATSFRPKRSLKVLDDFSISEKRYFVINLLNQCLPDIFQDQRISLSGRDKVWGELSRHHRYSKLISVTGSGSLQSQLSNTLHLLTVWATLIFLLAIFYTAQVTGVYDFIKCDLN